MTVGELLRRIDSRELAEWMAYYAIEPFGEERDDLRTGIIASTMANSWRGKGQKSMQPADFMPRFDGKKPKGQSLKDAKATFAKLKSAVKRRERKR